MLDIESLRRELYRAIDDGLERYMSIHRIITRSGLSITFVNDLKESYDYQWPEEKQTFSCGKWYVVSGEGLPTNGLRVLVARSRRWGWSKERAHVVVFGKKHASDDVKQLTPYAEFLEDDLGTFCSQIPNPLRPSETLKKGAPLPDRYTGATVKPNEELFHSIKQGPALRVVVHGDDETTMIEHAIFVASLRKRI
jgi:hypothetical protein